MDLYQDPYVTINTVTAHRGDGQPYPHRVVHARSGMGSIVVPVVNFRGNKLVAMVSQPRPPIGADASLEFPRGGTDDLSWSEASRELAEEVGLDVGDARPNRLGTIHPDTGILSTTVAVWSVCTKVDHLPPETVEQELGATAHWMHAASVRGGIERGEITCAMTISAYALAQFSGVLDTWSD